jgi:hypothetical protein
LLLLAALLSLLLSACSNFATWTKPTAIDCPDEAFLPGDPMVISDATDLVTTEVEDVENRHRTKILALRHKLARGCLTRAETAGYIRRVE